MHVMPSPSRPNTFHYFHILCLFIESYESDRKDSRTHLGVRHRRLLDVGPVHSNGHLQ
jgi:hypothetical protein